MSLASFLSQCRLDIEIFAQMPVGNCPSIWILCSHLFLPTSILSMRLPYFVEPSGYLRDRVGNAHL